MCCESMTITTILPATIVHIFSILVCKRMTFKQKRPGSNLPQQKCDAAEGAFAAFASHSKPSGGRVPYKKAAKSCRHQTKTVPLHTTTVSTSLPNFLPRAGQPTSQPLLLQATVGLMAHSALPGPNKTNNATMPRPRSPLLSTFPKLDQCL